MRSRHASAMRNVLKQRTRLRGHSLLSADDCITADIPVTGPSGNAIGCSGARIRASVAAAPPPTHSDASPAL
eukprot:2212157-Rhodomonas_salina.4